MSRTALAVLSSENLLSNARILQKLAPKSKLIAMVKANAYGHGLRSVSQRLSGVVDSLGVASIDEALALRKAGIKTSITLAEGVFEPRELIEAAAEGFSVVFHNSMQIDWLCKARLLTPISAWLKINTGMGRLGVPLDTAIAEYSRLKKSGQCKTLRLMSHLACSEDVEHPLNIAQKARFLSLLQQTGAEGSLANSAAIFHYPDTHLHTVRSGLAIYGVSPIPGKSAASLGLKPVMTVQSSLISVQRQEKGASIGYGARYICPEDMNVGIVAFGYGDGYPITARDGAPILVGDVRCPLIGRVSMDMLAVDLRQAPQATVGETVTLWGQGLPLEDLAPYTQNICWDILTGVQNRVKFLWTQGLPSESLTAEAADSPF